ncbi:MAG: ATP-binding protein [Clostridia bacterium]|nr:ATP-binding protein [Clostridia bacterium]
MDIELEGATQSEWKITLFRNVLSDNIFKKFMDLLKELTKTIPDSQRILFCYYDFSTIFISYAVEMAAPGRNIWEDYIIRKIIDDENLFSHLAECNNYNEIPKSVIKMAQSDMKQFQKIAKISGSIIRDIIKNKLGRSVDMSTLPDWEEVSSKTIDTNESKNNLLSNFNTLEAWEKGLPLLADYYMKQGVGIFGQYHAFRWVKNGAAGRFEGVIINDEISLDQLYEYEKEQKKVIENTEQFLAGYRANNVLLYGDRGTGKSSTVKALVNRYGKAGLRLIEVQKQDLTDFSLIISQLEKHPQRFILFIDDLSFSDQEGQYRQLKALLEGGLQTRPQNVIVYATTNRRHLVQESFADRNETRYLQDSEETRPMDTVQEKLSLADRFGITVTFMAPDQKRYLNIVKKIVQERQLGINSKELEQSALRWELNFNVRSARTARQFVDYLEGKLGLKRE